MNNEDTDESFPENLDRHLTKPGSEQSLTGRLQAEMSMFSSPFPPPQVLKAYDLVQPGLAAEIVDMAKRQSQHRMDMEKTVINGDNKRSWLGLIFGFILASGCLVSSTFLIQQGHDVAGGLFAGTTLASLTGTFVYGTNKRSQERAEKQRVLLEAGIGDDNK